jgi:hypothetical protein
VRKRPPASFFTALGSLANLRLPDCRSARLERRPNWSGNNSPRTIASIAIPGVVVAVEGSFAYVAASGNRPEEIENAALDSEKLCRVLIRENDVVDSVHETAERPLAAELHTGAATEPQFVLREAEIADKTLASVEFDSIQTELTPQVWRNGFGTKKPLPVPGELVDGKIWTEVEAGNWSLIRQGGDVVIVGVLGANRKLMMNVVPESGCQREAEIRYIVEAPHSRALTE